MKYFYFNPQDYGEQYHVMAETVEDAWAYLKIYLEGIYKSERNSYSQSYKRAIEVGWVKMTLEEYLNLHVKTPDQELAAIKETYIVEEFREGEVKVTEVS